MELIQEQLLGIISLLIIAAMVELRKRILKWIETRTTKEQRELLHKLAEEAFSYTETVFRDLKGKDKLDAAINYVSRAVKKKGIPLESYEIQAAIEKAVLQYNKTNS
jgi:arginine repressor